ncbi:MAG TPA: carboxymuconolactone decarboxylase family protein [Pseudonocardiaceae bacterium]
MVAGRVVSSVVQRQVRYVTPASPSAAKGLVAEIYRQVEDEMRIVIPPVLLHSPSPDVLAAYWMLMREPLMTPGSSDRLGKEAVAAAVSVANICPYCVDMHSTGMYDLGDEDDAEAIAADRVPDIVDERTRKLAAWGRVAHLPDAPLVWQPPFAEEERAELVGVAVGFHYLTRMVNVFLSNFLLPPRLGPGARRRLKRGIARVLAPSLRQVNEVGRSVPLLPEAELPAVARWASGNPAVAQAVARSYAAFEAAGERSLSPEVRHLVLRYLANWRGEETGLSRDWCEEAILDLPYEDQPAGRLALLTALASYQVDEEVIEEFQLRRPGDSALVDAASWASFAAARQVGSWHVPVAVSSALAA